MKFSCIANTVGRLHDTINTQPYLQHGVVHTPANIVSLSRFPNIWRHYQEVLTEMEHIKKIGIEEIYIGDRSFGLPRKNVISLLKEMVERDYGFSWSTYFHPNQYDPELFDLMVESGCHTVIIGVESADIKGLGKKVQAKYERWQI